MRGLILLYWGCVFLMYLSQTYYPVETQLDGQQTGKRHFMLRRADLFMVIVIAWMTCFSFLRTSYNDTVHYKRLYDQALPLKELIASFDIGSLTDNPLSLIYQSLFHDFTDNYNLYFFLPAYLSSFAVIKLFRRYSVNPAFSLLIFFSIGTYVIYVAALKQCFAMFFLLLSIPYAEEKKYVRFYLLVFLAILFHTHAFMFAIIPFLFGKPWGKVTWAGLVVTVIAMLTYDKTFGAFMEFAQSIGVTIVEEEIFDGHQINVLRVFVYWIPPIIALVFRKQLYTSSTRHERLFVNMSIVSAFILMIGLVEGANLYARMAAYFEIATAIALPWMIKKIFTKQSALFVTVIAVALYFVYFLYEFGVSKNFGADYSAISLLQFIQSLFS